MLTVDKLNTQQRFFAVRKDSDNVYHAFLDGESLCGVKLDSVQPILSMTTCAACQSKANELSDMPGLMPTAPVDLSTSSAKVCEDKVTYRICGYNFADDTYKLKSFDGISKCVPANKVSLFDGNDKLIAQQAVIKLDTSLYNVIYKQEQPTRLVAIDWEFNLITHELDSGGDKVSGIHLIQFPNFAIRATPSTVR